MILLHQFEISPFCDKIRRVMNVKNVPYETREVSLTSAMTGYRKINPAGKVPCIEHEGTVVADSTDIAHYLDEHFPEPRLIPSDPKLRAQCHVLEDWADESLYFYEVFLRFTLAHNAARWVPALTAHDNVMTRTFAPMLVPSTLRRTLSSQGLGRKTTAQVLRDLARQLDAIEGWLGDEPWLLGSALSLADIAVFAQLFCVRGADEGAEAIAARPCVVRWMDRVDAATARRA